MHGGRGASRRAGTAADPTQVELLARPAAATVRSYPRDRPATLGLSYAATAHSTAALSAEQGQPVEWSKLQQAWESCLPEDRSSMREHAGWLEAAEG
jgi:hypothetical protein